MKANQNDKQSFLNKKQKLNLKNSKTKTKKINLQEKDNIRIDFIKKYLDFFYEDALSNKDICLYNFKTKINNLEKNIKDLNIKNQAEIENIRKRALLDIKKIEKLALEDFITELLPVIDNLERAIEASKNIKDKLILSLIEGVKLTFKTLNNLLERFGVCVVDEKDVVFNPSIHQAVSIIETNNILSNHVLMIMQKGYILNGKLIRPAMVAVSKNKEDDISS